jgi:hypothetical protein
MERSAMDTRLLVMARSDPSVEIETMVRREHFAGVSTDIFSGSAIDQRSPDEAITTVGWHQLAFVSDRQSSNSRIALMRSRSELSPCGIGIT